MSGLLKFRAGWILRVFLQGLCAFDYIYIFLYIDIDILFTAIFWRGLLEKTIHFIYVQRNSMANTGNGRVFRDSC